MRRIQIQTRTSHHHTYKPRHKPLGFSIFPLMSILITPCVQSLNFEFKTNWRASKWPKTKERLKNGHLERENSKTSKLVRKRQTTNEKAKKNTTLSLTFSMQALPFGTIYHVSINISQPPGYKRVLPLCAQSLPLWQWTHQTQTERSRCNAWNQN
jgi:hypothetical protein